MGVVGWVKFTPSNDLANSPGPCHETQRMPAVTAGLVSPVMASEGSVPPPLSVLPGIVTGAWNPGIVVGAKPAGDCVSPAKLNIARKAPTEQRPKATKIRGSRRPD